VRRTSAQILTHQAFVKPFVEQLSHIAQTGHTAMGGGFIGSLLSLYASVAFAETYGNIAIFLPALWFNPQLVERQHSASKCLYVGMLWEAAPKVLYKCYISAI